MFGQYQDTSYRSVLTCGRNPQDFWRQRSFMSRSHSFIAALSTETISTIVISVSSNLLSKLGYRNSSATLEDVLCRQTMNFREYNITVSSGSDGGNAPAGKESDSFVLEAADPADEFFVWSRCQAPTVDTKARTLLNRLRQLGQDLFLPVGYPNSVAEGYLEYQLYDSVQGLCTYLRGVVSTSAVLVAAGVGDAEATAMSAAMTWAIRDGFGMIGGLFFSYKASPHFDAHVKEFRLMADVFNDIGLTLDLALPILLSQTKPSWIPGLSNYLPSPYLVLTSISTLCKVACGICAGATKGNITDHFAVSGNRADVNAKENTQETLVSLLGMIMGIGLAKWLHYLEKKDGISLRGDELMTDTQLISWTIFLILTTIHIWANYVGIQKLQLCTLNGARAKVLLHQIVENCSDWVMGITDNDDAAKILTRDRCVKMFKAPRQIKESLWTSLLGMLWMGNIHLGIRLRNVAKITSNTTFIHRGDGFERVGQNNLSSSLLQSYLKDEFGHENYVILIEEKATKSQSTVSVVMRVGAGDVDELKAFVHAHILHRCIERATDVSQLKLLRRSHKITESLFERDENGFNVHSILSRIGWDMSRLYLGFSPWRCEWTNKDE